MYVHSLYLVLLGHNYSVIKQFDMHAKNWNKKLIKVTKVVTLYRYDVITFRKGLIT